MFCEHCYSSSGKNIKETDWVLLKKQVEEVNPLRLIISGGETMLVRGKIKELVLSLKGRPFVIIATNGSLLNKEICEDIKSFADRLQISLDSMDANTYFGIRKVDLHKTVLEGIKNARRAGIEVQIAYCVFEKNLDHFYDVMDFAKENGVIFLNVLLPRPSGRSIESLTMKTVLSQYKKILSYGKKIGLKVNIHDPALFKNRLTHACLAGRDIVAIDVDNRFRPCPMMDLAIDKEFIKSWNSKEFNDVRKLPSCRKCKIVIMAKGV
jgi:MoaA/NifB/PqqE/SkfB family radical SAM enzyme